MPLYPDDESDPYLLRVDLSQFGIGRVRVVSSRDSPTGTATLHPEFMPLTLRRRRAWRGPWQGAHE